jgi:hypothetical protein
VPIIGAARVSSFLLRLPRRALGAALLIAGGLAIAAPLATGEWSVQLLSIPLFVLAIAEAYTTFRSPQVYQPQALPNSTFLARRAASRSRRKIFQVLGVLREAAAAVEASGDWATLRVPESWACERGVCALQQARALFQS